MTAMLLTTVAMGNPQREALFVVGTVSIPTLNAADEAIAVRLEQAGYTITVVEAPASATADANGKALVVVSSTVNSGDVGTKFRDSAVPVVVWEQALQDDFMMTGNAGDVDRGTLAGQYDLEIVDSSHPLAAGFSGIVGVVDFEETFSWGNPVGDAIKIAQIPGDPGKFPIYVYDSGTAMFNNFIAPARRVMLFMGDPTFEVVSPDGLTLFDAVIDWAGTRPSNGPPVATATITISSPEDGANFAAGGDILIEVNASDPSGPLQRVEYFAQGAKIGESSTAPYSFVWTAVPDGSYTVSATAVDQNDLGISSPTVALVVGTPPPEVLYVYGTVSVPDLNGADAGAVARLQRTGFGVRLVEAPSSTSADAEGKALVLVSSTVNSGDVGAKFRDVEIPVIVWEQAVQDDFQMTGDIGDFDRGTLGGQTEVEIIDSSHPLAAGLSGIVPIVNSAETFSWGYPLFNAIAIGQIPADPDRIIIYAYEAGELLYDGTSTPARRVMLPMGDPTFANMNENGLRLFDAAVSWAANLTSPLQPVGSTANVSISSPAEGASFATGSDITISVTATDSNGPIRTVEFFADDSKIGDSTTAPFAFTWTDVPVGNYTLSAKAVDRQSLVVNSTPVNVVVGTPGPEVLFVVGTVSIPSLNASDTAIRTRLEQTGFTVKAVQAPASTDLDAVGKALIVTSSTVASGDVATKFRDATVPVINWEQALQDDYGMTGNDGTDHSTIDGQFELEILESSHPLAAGLQGIVTIVNDVDTFSWGFPVDSAIRIAQIPGEPTMFLLYAYEAGTVMSDGFVAPARRVMLPMGDDSFEMLTDDGFKLFDAAVEWAVNLSAVPPTFAALVVQGDHLVLSWSGASTLLEAAQVTGPWINAANQANPQNTPLTGAAKFYRLRQ